MPRHTLDYSQPKKKLPKQNKGTNSKGIQAKLFRHNPHMILL